MAARGDRQALLRAAEAVRGAESLAHLAATGRGNSPLALAKATAGASRAGVANGEPARAASAFLGLSAAVRAVLLGLARGVRGAPRAGHLVLHAGDQILEIERLAGERAGALALGVERLLGLADGGAARVDQRREARALLRQAPQLRRASGRARPRSCAAAT